jgi:hypothetical protein
LFAAGEAAAEDWWSLLLLLPPLPLMRTCFTASQAPFLKSSAA